MKLYLALPDDLPHVMPVVAGLIDDALTNHSANELSLPDIVQGLVEQRMQLWIAMDNNRVVQAVTVTQIATYPQKRRLRFLTLRGLDIEKWVGMLKNIEDWALAHGCVEIEAWVRPGLRKMLVEKQGFERQYEVVTKELRGTIQ